MTDDIKRACILQAKWNGTTIEEEMKHYTQKKQFNRQEVLSPKSAEPRHLPKHLSDACKYYNQHVLNRECVNGECTEACEHCVCRGF